MRHLRILATAELAVPACGGDDDNGDDQGGTKPAAASASSIDRLELSTLSPEVHDSSGSGAEILSKDPRVERRVEGCATNPDQPPPT